MIRKAHEKGTQVLSGKISTSTHEDARPRLSAGRFLPHAAEATLDHFSTAIYACPHPFKITHLVENKEAVSNSAISIQPLENLVELDSTKHARKVPRDPGDRRPRLAIGVPATRLLVFGSKRDWHNPTSAIGREVGVSRSRRSRAISAIPAIFSSLPATRSRPRSRRGRRGWPTAGRRRGLRRSGGSGSARYRCPRAWW